MNKDQIDWHEQWKAHAHNFHDGYAHIEWKKLKIPIDGTIILAPGPGFGDLSHPTTKLVLKMLYPVVRGKRVLDVGCGSGILSLAAAQFGAQEVFGVDIDDEAIAHATHNAALNGLSHICRFQRTAPDSADIILMNMIRTEQQQAYIHIPARFEYAITSGILKQERARYHKQTAGWGWKLVQEKQEQGWLGHMYKKP